MAISHSPAGLCFQVCTMVTTAEYCQEVVGALARNVARMLDPPFDEQVHCILPWFVRHTDFVPAMCR